MNKYWCTFLVLTVFLTSCAIRLPGQRLDCDQVAGKPLRGLFTNQVGRDRFTIEAGEAYGIKVSEFSTDTYDPKQTVVTERIAWTVSNNLYMAYFIGQDLKLVVMEWHSVRPTGAEIVKCFGTPAFYRAYYTQGAHSKILDLALLYPDQGVVAQSHLFSNDKEPPRIDSSMLFWNIAFVSPGGVDQIVEDVYIFQPAEQRTEILNKVKPWPGAWHNLTVDIDPRMLTN